LSLLAHCLKDTLLYARLHPNINAVRFACLSMADTFSSLPISHFVRDWVFVTLFRLLICKGGLSLKWVHLVCCFKSRRFLRAGFAKSNEQINIHSLSSGTYIPVILNCNPGSCCVICYSVLVFEHVTTIFLTPRSPRCFLYIKTKILYARKKVLRVRCCTANCVLTNLWRNR